VPVLLGGMFRAPGRGSWGRTDARTAGMAEVERRAAERGLPAVRWPDGWPGDGLRAMRAAAYAHGLGEDAGRGFALAAFRLEFHAARSIEDEETLREAALYAGLDAETLLGATADAEVKARLRANTDRALAAGAVGVPALVAGGAVFWGDDRLEEAAAALAA
jgi:2-hydroxychromene-2-carboxylate isomerase